MWSSEFHTWFRLSGRLIIILTSFCSEFVNPDAGLLRRQGMAPGVGLREPLLGNGRRSSRWWEVVSLVSFLKSQVIQVCELTFEVHT